MTFRSFFYTMYVVVGYPAIYNGVVIVEAWTFFLFK